VPADKYANGVLTVNYEFSIIGYLGQLGEGDDKLQFVLTQPTLYTIGNELEKEFTAKRVFKSVECTETKDFNSLIY